MIIIKWYALFVETGYEDYVCSVLETKLKDQKPKFLVPKRKIPEKRNGVVHHVIRPLFPGYIFIQIKMNTDTYYQIQETENIIRVLNHGYLYTQKIRKQHLKKPEDYRYEEYYFLDIPPCELNIILSLINQSNIIDYSQVYFEGTKVFVMSGPLKNMEGIIKKIDKRRNKAKIELHLLGNCILVDVGIEIIQALVLQ